MKTLNLPTWLQNTHSGGPKGEFWSSMPVLPKKKKKENKERKKENLLHLSRKKMPAGRKRADSGYYLHEPFQQLDCSSGHRSSHHSSSHKTPIVPATWQSTMLVPYLNHQHLSPISLLSPGTFEICLHRMHKIRTHPSTHTWHGQPLLQHYAPATDPRPTSWFSPRSSCLPSLRSSFGHGQERPLRAQHTCIRPSQRWQFLEH